MHSRGWGDGTRPAEGISLHVAGQLSRLRKSGPLVEATARTVVALDLHGQVFQAFCRECCERCLKQLSSDAAPLTIRQT